MTFTLPNTIANEATRDARPVQANFAAIAAALNTDVVLLDGTLAMTGALELYGTPSADNHAAPKSYVDDSVPVGVIWDYAGAAAPSALWGLCQGQLASIAANPLLYALIGSTYGTETGTQFFLPDLRNRVSVGLGTDSMFNVLGETGGSTDAVAVNHAHADTFAVVAKTETHVHGNTIANEGFVVTGPLGPDGGPWALDLFDGGTAGPTFSRLDETNTQSDDTHGHNLSGAVTNLTGENGNNKNVQPYITLNRIIRLG